MIRLSLAVALAGLLLTGCGHLGDVFAQEVPAEQPGAVTETPRQPVDEGNENIKTPLIRALIQTVDEANGESDEVKDSLKKALREADGDLSKVLGGKSKMLIMQANRKPPMPLIGARHRQVPEKTVAPAVPAESVKKPVDAKAPAEEKKVEEAPAAKLPAAESGNPFEAEPKEDAPALPKPELPAPDETSAATEVKAQPPMLETLLKTIDADDAQSPEVKARLKEMLRKANDEMDGVLSAKPVAVREPKKAASTGPVIRSYRHGGMKVQEFHSP